MVGGCVRGEVWRRSRRAYFEEVGVTGLFEVDVGVGGVFGLEG